MSFEAETSITTYIAPGLKERMAQQLEALGWRRCAVGQRDTQHCGLVEEARAQERARIRALVQAEFDRLGRQCVPTRVPFEEGRIAALHHVLTMISLEDKSHD